MERESRWSARLSDKMEREALAERKTVRDFVKRAAESRYTSAVIWTVYLLIPVRATGLFQGVPLGPLEAVTLLGIWWLALVNRRMGRSRLVVAAVFVTLIVSFAAPGEHGFRARYYADAAASGPIELSTEFRRTDVTRIDQRLDFVRGGPELPLVFFNDIARF